MPMDILLAPHLPAYQTHLPAYQTHLPAYQTHLPAYQTHLPAYQTQTAETGVHKVRGIIRPQSDVTQERHREKSFLARLAFSLTPIHIIHCGKLLDRRPASGHHNKDIIFRMCFCSVDIMRWYEHMCEYRVKLWYKKSHHGRLRV
eukprot:scpid108014/ scgid5475/ 